MERGIERGAGVRYQLYLPNFEFRARSVMVARFFPAQKITDERRRQTLVGNHAVLDRVAEIDEVRHWNQDKGFETCSWMISHLAPRFCQTMVWRPVNSNTAP